MAEIEYLPYDSIMLGDLSPQLLKKVIINGILFTNGEIR